MVFFMQFFRKFSLLLVILGLLAAMAPSSGQAEGITVRQAKIYGTEEGYFADAEFDLELTPALEEALTRGVPLTFKLSLDVIEPRWYWFNKEIVNLRQERRLSFNPLTRVYRFSIGSLYLSFNSLQDALQSLSHVNRLQLAAPGSVAKEHQYEARIQLKLDVSQLPKPFQVDALSSNDWNLASKPLSWKLSP